MCYIYGQCVHILYFKFDQSMIVFYKKLMYDPLDHKQLHTIL